MVTLKFQYDSDATALTSALRIAAEQYDSDAQATLDNAPLPVPEGLVRLARAFKDQAATARRLASEIDGQE